MVEELKSAGILGLFRVKAGGITGETMSYVRRRRTFIDTKRLYQSFIFFFENHNASTFW